MNTNKLQVGWHNLWGYMGGVSIRTKIFGIVLGSTLILSSAFVYQSRLAIFNMLEHTSNEQGISVARDIAARATDLILINDLFTLHELLEETRENFEDVSYAFILDPNGKVLTHTFGEGFPLELIGVNSVGSDEYQHTVSLKSNNEIYWDVAVPIFGGKAGTARVGIVAHNLKPSVTNLSVRLLITLLGVLLGSLIAASLLTLVLTKPILTLVDATKKIAEGDFSPRVDRWANDEIGDLAESFNQMASELGRTDKIRKEGEQLRRQLLEGVIGAQEEERRRIARELHDSTSQSLTSLKIGLKNIEEHCDNPDIAVQIEKLMLETNKTLDDVHELAVQLRPTVLDDLGIEVALGRLVTDWNDRHNKSADVFVHIGKERLPGAMETAIYRIVQEALTNIAKHSSAKSVSVLVERRDGDIVAIVEDDGVGFDPEGIMSNGRLGILGMQERTNLLNGTFKIETKAGGGTSIFVTIPACSESEKLDARKV